MAQFKVLCFTKDRPLQCTAYLESLIHYSSLAPEAVTVIYCASDIYDNLRSAFHQSAWIGETGPGSFDDALRRFSAELNDDDVVLFGCDDVMFLRSFCPADIQKIVCAHATEGFTLRGDGRGLTLADGTRFRSGRIDYPFEVMASAYSGVLIKAVVNSRPSDFLFRLPNDVEAWGVGYAENHTLLQRMWRYDGGAIAVGQDVNRVQDAYPDNVIRGGQEHSPQRLLALYQAGYRLDWKTPGDADEFDIFVGTRYWKLLPPRPTA